MRILQSSLLSGAAWKGGAPAAAFTMFLDTFSRVLRETRPVPSNWPGQERLEELVRCHEFRWFRTWQALMAWPEVQ